MSEMRGTVHSHRPSAASERSIPRLRSAFCSSTSIVIATSSDNHPSSAVHLGIPFHAEILTVDLGMAFAAALWLPQGSFTRRRRSLQRPAPLACQPSLSFPPLPPPPPFPPSSFSHPLPPPPFSPSPFFPARFPSTALPKRWPMQKDDKGCGERDRTDPLASGLSINPTRFSRG